MKKFFLLLTTLVLGFGQLFADEVTFSASELRESLLPSGNTSIAIPYTWKVSPYHVSVNIAKQNATEASLGVGNTINMNNTFQFTVSISGAGTLNSIKISTTPNTHVGNATASTGTYSSGTWAPE